MSEITIILGNVGRDAERRYTAGGKPVTNFSVAVSVGRDADGKERPAKWYNISAWGKLADICEQYVKKGMKVQIQGVVNARAYLDPQNRPVAALDLMAHRIEFASRAPEDVGQSNGYEGDYSAAPEDDIPF